MWMYTLLPKVLNMSLTAGIVIVFVLLARILLKKTPKIFSYVLWAVVLFRLVCPISFSSEFSLMRLLKTPTTANGSIPFIPTDIVHAEYPQVNLPIPDLSTAINDNLSQGEEQLAADPLEWQMAAATLIWLCGITMMLAYSAVSFLLLRRKLIGAVRLTRTIQSSSIANYEKNTLSHGNIYLADHIATPFVIGLLRPKIFLPSVLTEYEQSYVILHEQTHIKRLDHIVKMIAFLALAMHWFNPLVWVAFLTCVKDMEMSCDERVIKEMGAGIKADYSASLLSLSAGRRLINGSPLAFGEGNIKGRIKNVLNFRKPTTLVIAVSAVIVIALSIGFAANRGDDKSGNIMPATDVNKITPYFSESSSLETSPLTANDLRYNISNDIEQSISNALLSYNFVDKSGLWYETAGEGHITLETQDKDGLTYAYILEKYYRLGFENGILTGISGHANPAVIVFERDGEGCYIFMELIRPNDGKGYRQSLEKIFSPSALKKLDNADMEKCQASMNEQIEAYARAYLEKTGQDAEIQIEIDSISD